MTADIPMKNIDALLTAFAALREGR